MKPLKSRNAPLQKASESKSMMRLLASRILMKKERIHHEKLFSKS